MEALATESDEALLAGLREGHARAFEQLMRRSAGKLAHAHRHQPGDHALRRLLERAIDLLPPIYRSVFILRAVHGLMVEDTAAGLEVSPEVVMTRFLRARALLRARLQADPQGGAATLHEFGGCRCHAIVQAALAQLFARGWLRAPAQRFTPP